MHNLRQQVEQPQYDLSITHSYIYALVDPITGFVRYVGKSHNPKERLIDHVRPGSLKAETFKNRWLRKILKAGKKPTLILLEKVSNSEWQDAERKWIAYYRTIPGYPRLTNVMDGGEGAQKGTKASEETKRKQSIVRTGKKMPPFTDEHCRRISEAVKSAWTSMSDEEKKKKIETLHKNAGTEEVRKNVSFGKFDKRLNRKDRTSRFFGVSLKRGKHWTAFLVANGETLHLGYFVSEVDAAHARDIKAIEIFGDATPLNFPRSEYEGEYNAPRVSDHRATFKGNRSGYKGVIWSKKSQQWECGSKLRGKYIYIGMFPPTEEGKIEAAQTYDRWIIANREPTAYTNFPRNEYAGKTYCDYKTQNNGRRIQKNNTSGYKGVYWRNDIMSWVANLKVNGRSVYFYKSDDLIECAKMYDRAAIKHLGDIARTNFPRSDYD
jgi:hypothetical protein